MLTLPPTLQAHPLTPCSLCLCVCSDPKILLLNIELELKSEKENAEVRLDDPAKYQSIVDAEWNIIYSKLAECANSGAQIVLSRCATETERHSSMCFDFAHPQTPSPPQGCSCASCRAAAMPFSVGGSHTEVYSAMMTLLLLVVCCLPGWPLATLAHSTLPTGASSVLGAWQTRTCSVWPRQQVGHKHSVSPWKCVSS